MQTKTSKRAPAARRRPAAGKQRVPPVDGKRSPAVTGLAEAGAGKERGGIQSLERAFAILEEIAANPRGIALADLCRTVGLHSSTTFHLVRTLVQLGYASQDAESRKYRIGRKVFSLASGALDENELVVRATPMLERLAQQTGESAHFAILAGGDVVIAVKTEGPGMFRPSDRAGVVRPANATAIGKVLLAAMTPEQVDRYLARHTLPRFTPKTIVERDALLAELAEVRRLGIAFDDGEFNAEARCVAVPVHDFHGRVAGALGISGPMWRLSLQSLHEKSRHVQQVAAELSAELGHRGAKTAQAA
jgi:DNA-binding IclR family transcriptional regulator